MLVNGNRVCSLLGHIAPVRGSEWLHFHNSAVDGGFGHLGGGYGTWILHARFRVIRAGWYAIQLNPAPHAQAVYEGSSLSGLAWASQNGRKPEGGKPKSINASDRVVCYLDPGEAELRLQLPIVGDGSGREPAEPNLVAVASLGVGDVVLLTPAIVPSLVVTITAPGPVPGPAPAPLGPSASPVASAPPPVIAPPVVPPPAGGAISTI